MYKSFIICDDPKGVVECGTMRKYKNSAQKTEHKTESGKPQKHSAKELKHKSKETEKEEMITRRAPETTSRSSSSQVLEIAKGAQKLNRMIESWSKGIDFDSQSKEVTKELLKGALDLQESLAMLGKLEETSRYITMSKKKQMVNTGRGNNELLVGRPNLNPSRDLDYNRGQQKPRLSVDGYYGNNVEDLKDAVRSSLSRENCLATTNFEQKSDLYQRNLDFASEMPSTSSSHSSLVHSDIFDSVDSSMSSSIPENKIRGPSLVAKLMGLEEMPSKPFQTTFKKQLDSEKVFNQKRPIFDFELPAGRRSPHAALKSYPERRLLDEIHKAEKCKRIPTVDSGKCLQSQPHQSNGSCPEQRLVDDNLPIVLIKPLHISCKDYTRPVRPMLQDSKAFHTEKKSRKQVTKGKPTLERIYSKEATFATTKTMVKVEGEETPITRLSQEVVRVSKSVVRKPSEEESRTVEKVKSIVKATGPLNHTMKKGEETEMKSDKIEKTRVINRRTPEKDSPKSNSMSRSRSRANLTTTKQKLDEGLRITKNQTSQQQSKFFADDGRKKQIRKHRVGTQPVEANSYADKSPCKDHDKKIDHKSEEASRASKFNEVVHEITTEKRTPTKLQTKGNSIQICDQSTVCSVLPETYGYERHFKLTKQAQFHLSHGRKNEESSVQNLKYFLLSSQSFLSHAKEYFDVYTNIAVVSQASDIKDSGITDHKLSLVCAIELVERRRVPHSLTLCSLLQTSIGNSRICISLDHLVEEVCYGIDFLRSYNELSSEDSSVDGACAMLDKDLAYQNFTNANWDMGWRYGYSVSDAEDVLSAVEKMLLNELIEEICHID